MTEFSRHLLKITYSIVTISGCIVLFSNGVLPLTLIEYVLLALILIPWLFLFFTRIKIGLEIQKYGLHKGKGRLMKFQPSSLKSLSEEERAWLFQHSDIISDLKGDLLVTKLLIGLHLVFICFSLIFNW